MSAKAVKKNSVREIFVGVIDATIRHDRFITLCIRYRYSFYMAKTGFVRIGISSSIRFITNNNTLFLVLLEDEREIIHCLREIKTDSRVDC